MRTVKHREALGRSRSLQAREEDPYARFARSERRRARKQERRQRKHTALWVTLSAVSVAGILCCAGLLLPQMGTADPSFTFFRRGFATHDRAGEARLAEDKKLLEALSGKASAPDPAKRETPSGTPTAEPAPSLLVTYEGKFGPGIYIDGIDVSAMTREEALAATEAVPAEGGGEFSITVVAAGLSFTIDSDQIPMTRNLSAVVQAAWTRAQRDFNASPEWIDGEPVSDYNLRVLHEREKRLKARDEEPVYFQSRLDFSREAIRERVEGIAAAIRVNPVDAALVGFDPATKTFSVRNEHSGVTLDAEALYKKVVACLEREEPYATVTVEPQTVPAGVTADSIRARLGRISSYTTKTTSNKNRNTNVRLSAEAINGYRVDPGEVFSFNQATGQRTEKKGYKPAVAISGGATRDEIGGGVCQTSSTLFNAVARADLEIVTRNPHAWPSSYVEKGLDATVNWPDLDFRWRNDTDQPIWIVAAYADRQVTVELYGMTLADGIRIELESVVTRTIPKPTDIRYVNNTDLPVGTRKQTVNARKGYEVETWKVWSRDGYELKREILFTTTYKAYQETWEYN